MNANVTKERFMGVLQVDNKFYRPEGDVGSPLTWDFPVKIKIVSGATTDETVKSSSSYSQEFIDKWVNDAEELVDQGASCLITSCGFLAALHSELQSKFDVPIGTSSLLQIPLASRFLPKGKRIGVVTFDVNSLSERHLSEAGATLETPIVGVKEGCSFQKYINEEAEFDFKSHLVDLIEASKRLVETNDNIGGIVFECANMHPYKKSVQMELNLPIWDIVTLGNYVYDASVRV